MSVSETLIGLMVSAFVFAVYLLVIQPNQLLLFGKNPSPYDYLIVALSLAFIALAIRMALVRGIRGGMEDED